MSCSKLKVSFTEPLAADPVIVIQVLEKFGLAMEPAPLVQRVDVSVIASREALDKSLEQGKRSLQEQVKRLAGSCDPEDVALAEKIKVLPEIKSNKL